MMLERAVQVQLAFFKGRSLTSRAIRWITWGEYSHVGIFFPETDMIVEAWHYGGVLMNRFGRRHTPGTEVDIYEFVKHPDEKQLIQGIRYLYSQMGKPYDFAGVFGFLTRRDNESREKIFCSELAFEFCLSMGIKPLEIPSYKVNPSNLAASPSFKKFRTRHTR
jgi:uncharacterized protein YycO